jgi:hypothetical protein
MTQQEIIDYQTTNEIKVYKLNQLGFSNEEIVIAMKPLFVNTKGARGVAYVKTILNDFSQKPEKIKKANKIPD